MSTISNDVDLEDHQELTESTTIAVIIGYFRKHGFFYYNVKIDDFVNIISNYLLEMQLIFSNNNKNDIVFDKRVTVIDILDENCFIAVSFDSELMLSTICIIYIYILIVI